jgi:hypothetical protein
MPLKLTKVHAMSTSTLSGERFLTEVCMDKQNQ